MKKHEYAIKDEQGNWLIRCPLKGGSFSSKMWSDGNYPQNKCPCCKKDVRTENVEEFKTKKVIKYNRD